MSGFSVAYPLGFNPRMKMSFGSAISVGYESNCAIFNIEFVEYIDLVKFK